MVAGERNRGSTTSALGEGPEESTIIEHPRLQLLILSRSALARLSSPAGRDASRKPLAHRLASRLRVPSMATRIIATGASDSMIAGA